MSRLIDADALKKAFNAESIFYKQIDDIINDASTVDAVPVVRCRECRYVHQREDIFMCRGYRQTQADGFCNRGAKMEGGE